MDEPQYQGPRRGEEDYRLNGWRPPETLRAAAWLVREVGLPVVLSGLFIALVLGWIGTPLARLSVMEAILLEHAKGNEEFQKSLLDGLRKQRCMTAIVNLEGEAGALAAAAAEPCVYLENLRRASVRPRP
jgi:hypothetical protein